MAKRKAFSKKSINRLPKGLPVRAGGNGGSRAKSGPTSTTGGTTINPFEMTQRMKRPKFAVHNRGTATDGTTGTPNQPPPQRLSALAESLSKRQAAIRNTIQASKKSNQFIDQRIGEANHLQKNQQLQQQYASNDAKNLARLVRERTRQSQRLSKYALSNGDDDDDDDNNGNHHILTHKGTAIKDMTDVDHVILSDDDDDDDLDAYDTELHFGGKGITRKDATIASTYGVNQNDANDLSTTYTQKKLDLDDLIIRRKTLKLERIKSREAQISTFDAMDTTFSELTSLLQFRNKEEEIKTFIQQKRQHALSPEDQEYDDWDREMKQYVHSTTKEKIAATDRTKTPEEIAKEEAEALHQKETRRLARMNGDFENEDLDDDDDDDDDDHGNHKYSRKRRKMEHQHGTNPEVLDDDDDDWNIHAKNDQPTTRFTSEGLVYVDRNGNVIGKVGDDDDNLNVSDQHDDNDDDDDDNDDDAETVDDDDNDDDDDDGDKPMIHQYKVGDRVVANYRAKEQFDGHEAWYHGTVTKVVARGDTHVYNLEYDDGDVEDNVEPQYIRRPLATDQAAVTTTTTTSDDDDDIDDNMVKETAMELKRKRQKAMEKARYVISVHNYENPPGGIRYIVHSRLSKNGLTIFDPDICIDTTV